MACSRQRFACRLSGHRPACAPSATLAKTRARSCAPDPHCRRPPATTKPTPQFPGRDPHPTGELKVTTRTREYACPRRVIDIIAVGDQGVSTARFAGIDRMEEIDRFAAGSGAIGRLHLPCRTREVRSPAILRYARPGPTCKRRSREVHTFRGYCRCEPRGQDRACNQQCDGRRPQHDAPTGWFVAVGWETLTHDDAIAEKPADQQ